ncbi:MAG: TraR/DksA C4-type zinc finger protein [Candidatus Zambryskibacteria bacterium]|nr:TraR/DksA C4-type zinc finger protein [Candidatus Zambryskibacteria bacterium]
MDYERYLELKEMLEKDLHHFQNLNRVHQGRLCVCKEKHADDGDRAAECSGDEVDGLLNQLYAMRIKQIEHALERLERGEYGNCFDCGGEISERRLRALRFAVRCRACEEKREAAQVAERKDRDRRSSDLLSLG